MKVTKRQRAARVGAALGHPTRLAILELLAEHPRIVGEIIEEIGARQPAVSKHLSTLRAAGLLACEPDGRCRRYRLADPKAVRRALKALGTLG